MAQSILQKFDTVIDRVLFIEPIAVPVLEPESDEQDQLAQNAFSFSLVFSGVRCILQYVALPFILPLVGIAAATALPLLMVINVLAIVSIVFSVRRFWTIRYSHRWVYLPVAVGALTILIAYTVYDLLELGVLS